MNLKLFPLVVVCLFLTLTAFSQNKLRLDERAVKAFYEANELRLEMPFENPSSSAKANIKLEILDVNGNILAAEESAENLKSGRQTLKIPVVFNGVNADDLIWYRLRYAVSPSANADFAPFSGVISLSEIMPEIFEIRAVGSRLIAAGMKYRVNVRAFHPVSGRASADVKVSGEVELDVKDEKTDNKLKLTAQATTNRNGYAMLVFEIPAGATLEDDGDVNLTGEKNGIRRTATQDLDSLTAQNFVYLNTDKPIYQPGQDFHVRGWYLTRSAARVSKAQGEKEIEFSVEDEDDTTLYRETVKTSRFGIAAINWKIPENAKLGTYSVKIKSDDEPVSDQINFKVSRYDLPNFAVTAKPGKPFYLPNEKTAEITVSADYLFGKPVVKGTVKVVRETDRNWNYSRQKWEVEEDETHEGATDANGAYKVEIDLTKAHADLQTEEYRRFDDLRFAAYFTDAATNRTEQKRFDVRVSKEAIHVYLVGVKPYDERNPKLPVKFYVSTFYADGAPAECDLEIKGKYESEAENRTRSLLKIKTNRLGAGKAEFIAPKPDDEDSSDDLQIKVFAADAAKQTGTQEEKIRLDEYTKQIQITTKKTVFRGGETIDAEIVSSEPDADVFVDVAQDYTVIDSQLVKLKNGRASVKIPYRAAFKGELTVAAYFDNGTGNAIKDAKGIVFYQPAGLNLAAEPEKNEYRPGAEATVNFNVAAFDKIKTDSALGVVVFDKAIDERARADAEFGGSRAGSVFGQFASFLSDTDSLGGMTASLLNRLDPKAKIPGDLQLSAEMLLANRDYDPDFFESDEYGKNQFNIFENYFKLRFETIRIILKDAYAADYTHPTGEDSLKEILSKKAFDFASLRDPWEMPYLVKVETERNEDALYIRSSGADKIAGSADDFVVLQLKFNYFTPLGKKIDRAAEDFHRKTGAFIRDYQTLRGETLKQNVDLDQLKDRFGRAYEYVFGVDGRFYEIEVKSDGKDGKKDENYYSGDDFNVWSNRIDYYADAEAKIQAVLSNYSAERQSFPQNETEFKDILRNGGINLDELSDGFGRAPYLEFKTFSRYSDRVKTEVVSKYGEKTKEKTSVQPVTQTVVAIVVRSAGNNDKKGDGDDFDLTTFSGVISEQSKDDAAPREVKTETIFTGGKGAVRGTITDSAGAVVPNTKINAMNEQTKEIIETLSNEDGVYLLKNLPSGTYRISAISAGFATTIIQNVPVQAATLTELNFTLNVGATAETVDVTAGDSAINTTDASMSSNITQMQTQDLPLNGRRGNDFVLLKSGIAANKKTAGATILEENSTPKLREYFPETLLWQPEIVTDKNGKAQIKFKLGDNITTWKVYAIATDLDGRVGLSEKEIRAFQPFFVDLEPPKILTVGDEIYLPAQIRNYTDAAQKVNVSMAKSDWFSFLPKSQTRPSASVQSAESLQTVEVAPNDTQNAVFGYRAERAVKSGAQKITALAGKESDAIEKRTEVHPNGKEIVRTESEIVRDAVSFDLDFPADALPFTPNAELKIYPNLLAHIAESAEGLLKRPYGCGEQTISSTYPNLLILKVLQNQPDSQLKTTAQKYLQNGYERLLGYQQADGGFAVWAKDDSDIALTAYALRFLNDARAFVEVDETVIENAQKWLASEQRKDGSWAKKYRWEQIEDKERTKILSTYITRSLTLAERGKKEQSKTVMPVLQKALAYLKDRNEEIDEPFALANFALALMDTGDAQTAAPIIEKLENLALSEGGKTYWNLETNTPFYGWGTPGRIETTALVVQSLVQWKMESGKWKIEESKAVDRKLKTDNLISRGTIFLLKNKDRYGVWYSTQATVNVLDALLAVVGDEAANTPKSANRAAEIYVGGQLLKTVELPAPDKLGFPLAVQLPVNNLSSKIEIKVAGNSSAMMAQIVKAHYISWENFNADGRNINQSRQIKLDYKCDKQTAQMMDEITCAVAAERVGFQGYGMLLAEIGIPPGAEIERDSLEKELRDNWSISRYEILPDKIIVYLWAVPGGTKFDFKFRPRYAINANAAPSVVYDYYNEEAKATLAPLKFEVK